MQGFQESNSEQVRDEANAWVARFAPLLMNTEVLTEPEVRERIQDSQRLQAEGRTLQGRLAEISETDSDLIRTFEAAIGQLDSIESDYRKQLAMLKPGDPEGIANLDAVNEKLAERMARKEVGLDTNAVIPDVLEMKVAPGNKGAAIGLGIFGLGWNAFTAFHATLMIGGMYQAFGLAALAMLAFYAIFFFAGIGMWIAAYNAGASEHIRLEGRELTVTKTLGPWRKDRTYKLGADSSAEIVEMQIAQVSSNKTSKKPTPVVHLHDVDGNPVGLGANATDAQRRQTRDKINAYLRVRGS
ncbi:MAG: hypothetical protein H7Y17_12620 [Chlorobia bacterium]|nr:hypothetical protein [Fimbriimonadaceae bacterium]